MRHRARSRKIGRTSAHRKAMYRNMVTSLLDHESIQTTDAKAKEVRRIAERMITLGKHGGLHARRRALRVIRSREVTAKVFDDLAERYRERPGGYTRVLKLRTRVGDAASLSLVQLVDGVMADEEPKGKKATRKKKEGKVAAPKKATAKKSTAKKATSKKSASKKSSAKKADTAKKSGARKASRKKG
jgi:large subunit ribosomal protein L17